MVGSGNGARTAGNTLLEGSQSKTRALEQVVTSTSRHKDASCCLATGLPNTHARANSDKKAACSVKCMRGFVVFQNWAGG